MIVDCVSDLHGHYPELEGGDLLIVAGDLTASSTSFEYGEFSAWLNEQNYRKQIYIAGNHDTFLEKHRPIINEVCPNAKYLCDSGTEFEGLKIWGSPWTKTFEGINPHCKAFTVDTEEGLAEKWKLIPDDVDILITHSAPWGMMDLLPSVHRRVGSTSLLKRLNVGGLKPKVHVFGHIHEGYGYDHVEICLKSSPKIRLKKISCKFVNASHVNEHYEPVNKPIRVIL